MDRERESAHMQTHAHTCNAIDVFVVMQFLSPCRGVERSLFPDHVYMIFTHFRDLESSTLLVFFFFFFVLIVHGSMLRICRSHHVVGVVGRRPS